MKEENGGDGGAMRAVTTLLILVLLLSLLYFGNALGTGQGNSNVSSPSTLMNR